MARLPSLARTRGDSVARLQRRVGNDGADRRAPLVSGGDEAERSDAAELESATVDRARRRRGRSGERERLNGLQG